MNRLYIHISTYYLRHQEKGILTKSWKTFAGEILPVVVRTFRVTPKKSVQFLVGGKLDEFDKYVTVKNWPFCELVGSLMWLSTSTRPDIPNAVRPIVSCCDILLFCAKSYPLEGSPWHMYYYTLLVRGSASMYGSTFWRGTFG